MLKSQIIIDDETVQAAYVDFLFEKRLESALNQKFYYFLMFKILRNNYL